MPKKNSKSRAKKEQESDFEFTPPESWESFLFPKSAKAKEINLSLSKIAKRNYRRNIKFAQNLKSIIYRLNLLKNSILLSPSRSNSGTTEVVIKEAVVDLKFSFVQLVKK